MKPWNFPDRKERRRRAAARRREETAVPSDNDLRPRDIKLRQKAGVRRKPGIYLGLGTLRPYQKKVLNAMASGEKLTIDLPIHAGKTRRAV